MKIRLIGTAMAYGQKKKDWPKLQGAYRQLREEPTNLKFFPVGLKRPKRESHNPA
jgi:hypothetical protein